ncbi:hypothetical protein [Lysobacter sp. A03]|uniref:hypothetical protein n=1 Tax=Lysobacter sp. A03 TaxID=1199154 RepID=UPI001364C5DF|nr:hypothetical protein [Lysobacter sp. A03]
MAGAPSPATGPSPARILADMEGGKPATVSARPAPRRKMLLLTAVAAGALALLWWWQAGNREEGFSSVDAPMHTGTAGIAADADRGAATIIEEPSPASGPNALSNGAGGAAIGAGDDDPLVSPFAASAPALATARSKRANPFTPGEPTRPGRQAARPAQAGTAKPGASGGEPDLMATLLGNIKAPEPEPVSGLDTLIRKMESEEASVVAGKQTASARLQPTRSQQIQSNLRECPPANTAKGLKCRQAICAVYAGRDPACPAD